MKGVVSEVTSIPFLEIRVYVLNDRGHPIRVVAKEMTPAVKAEVSVKGIYGIF